MRQSVWEGHFSWISHLSPWSLSPPLPAVSLLLLPSPSTSLLLPSFPNQTFSFDLYPSSSLHLLSVSLPPPPSKGPYSIGEDGMAFGSPTRYIMLDPSKVRPILVDGGEDGRLCTPSIAGPSTAPVRRRGIILFSVAKYVH